MHPVRVGDHRLDHVSVATRHPQHVTARVLGQAAVVLPDGRDGAGGHLGEGLTPGEDGRGGVLLHHRPHVFGRELGQGPSGPGAVVDLDQALLDHRFHPERGGQRLDRLPAAHERRPDDRLDRETVETSAEVLCLRPARLVERDPGRAAGQGERGVGGRAAVAQEDDGHDGRLPTPRHFGGEVRSRGSRRWTAARHPARPFVRARRSTRT